MQQSASQKRKNRGRQFGSRLTATISISLVLLLLAIMITLGVFAHELSDKARESIHITLVIDDNIQSQQLQRIKNHLEKATWSKAVRYIDKEAALKEVTAELGYSPAELLGYNPLPATFEVSLKAEVADLTHVKAIEQELKTLKGIEEVSYPENLIEIVNANLLSIGKILLAVALVLTFISFMLIRNTVRLMIYSQRFLIHTMCLVGARFSYIRRPFVRRNIGCGVISAILAAGLYYLSLLGLDRIFPGVSQMVDRQTFLLISGCLVVLGILLAAVSTVFAVNRYLRMSDSEMYYV